MKKSSTKRRIINEDVRTLEATQMVLKEGFANIILIGNPDEIKNLANKNDINIERCSNYKSCNI